MSPKARQNSRKLAEHEGRILLAVSALKSKKFAVFVKLRVFSMFAMKLYVVDLVEGRRAQKHVLTVIK
jgi:hypothetical protein